MTVNERRVQLERRMKPIRAIRDFLTVAIYYFAVWAVFMTIITKLLQV